VGAGAVAEGWLGRQAHLFVAHINPHPLLHKHAPTHTDRTHVPPRREHLVLGVRQRGRAGAGCV
jgi:hypothetical protein